MRILNCLAFLGPVLLFSGCGMVNQTASMGPAPTVVGVGMQSNGVATNRAIDVQFSTAMDPATVNGNTFRLAKASDGSDLQGTVTYDATNFVASFKASSAMDVNTTYNAVITTGAADMAGDHLAANYAFSFTTRNSSDSSDIKVYETVPTNGQSGVALTAVIQVVFTEGADSNTVNSKTVVVKDAGGTAVSGKVTYDIVTNHATFTPSAPLAPGTTYTVTISGVTDLAGEAMAPPYTFSFTTAGTAAKVQDLVYETDVSAGNISGWIFDSSTATLKSASGSPYPSALQPLQMIVSPNGQFLYAVMGNQPPGIRGSNCFNFNSQVISYTIDHSSGALTEQQQITLNGFCAQTSAAIDPKGLYLYVGESDGGGSAGMIDVLSLDNTGKMSLIAGSPFISPQTPTSLIVDGNFIYAANNVPFETEGLLTFTRNPSTGTVAFKSGMTMAPQQSVAVSLSGNTLYSVDANTGLISEFKVDTTTGTLVPQGTAASGSKPAQMLTDPTGKYLAVAAGNGVNLYDVGSSGGLTALAGSPFGGAASSVMFDSTASYFAALQGGVQVYSLNGNVVKPVTSTPGTANPGLLTLLTK